MTCTPMARFAIHFDMAPFRLVQIFEDGQVLKGEPPPSAP